MHARDSALNDPPTTLDRFLQAERTLWVWAVRAHAARAAERGGAAVRGRCDVRVSLKWRGAQRHRDEPAPSRVACPALEKAEPSDPRVGTTAGSCGAPSSMLIAFKSVANACA